MALNCHREYASSAWESILSFSCRKRLRRRDNDWPTAEVIFERDLHSSKASFLYLITTIMLRPLTLSIVARFSQHHPMSRDHIKTGNCPRPFMAITITAWRQFNQLIKWQLIFLRTIISRIRLGCLKMALFNHDSIYGWYKLIPELFKWAMLELSNWSNPVSSSHLLYP